MRIHFITVIDYSTWAFKSHSITGEVKQTKFQNFSSKLPICYVKFRGPTKSNYPSAEAEAAGINLPNGAANSYHVSWRRGVPWKLVKTGTQTVRINDQLISRLGLKITQSAAEAEISCSQQQPSGRQQQQHGVGRITQPLITTLPQAAQNEAIVQTL